MDDFFATEGIKKSVSQQALSKARNKFTCLPFKTAFDPIVSASYDDIHCSDLERFNGKFLIAIDCSTVALPNIPKLKHFLGTINKFPTARISMAYDALNDFVMDYDRSNFLMRLNTKFSKEIDALGIGSHIIKDIIT